MAWLPCHGWEVCEQPGDYQAETNSLSDQICSGKGVRYNREFKISVFVIWLLPDDRPVAMATGVHVQGGGGSWLARVKPEKHVEDV